MSTFHIYTYVKIHYNELIDETLLRTIPNEYLYKSDILNIDSSNPYSWELDLPPTNKRYLILHAQDFVRAEDLLKIENHQKMYNIETVVLIHWNHNLTELYNGTIKLIEFPTHSQDLVQDLIRNKDKWLNVVNNKTQDINYMCLNGILKTHRKDTYNYLSTLDIPSIVTSSLTPNSFNFPKYDDYNWDNIANYISLLDAYRTTPVNIITESLYKEPIGIITEKTLFAFASLQLPILVAHKGAVKDAESYGFDMFRDIIDHSYDDLPNDIRWKSAIDLNMRILKGEFDYNALLPRLKQNQEYLLNGYLDFIETRLSTDLFNTINN